MSKQPKPVPKDNLEVPHASLLAPEPSTTPLSSEGQSAAHFSTSSDGRVVFTFPSRGTQHRALCPQPARYEALAPTSESLARVNSQVTTEKTNPLRLLTEEALDALLDSNNPKATHQTHSAPGGDDIEAWIEASKKTIAKANDQESHGPEEENKPSYSG